MERGGPAWVLVLLVVAIGARAFSLGPGEVPAFARQYDAQTGLVHLQVNLTYVSAPDVLYTYVFAFSPWTQADGLFSVANCSNRRGSDFNANNPVLWSSLWAKLGVLNNSAISGSYLAWPTPALPWVVSVGGPSIVTYDAWIAIDALLVCAGDSIADLTDSLNFVYDGTFYVIWVQPVIPYVPGLPYSAVYSTQSYPFPFVISIPRDVGTVDNTPLAPSFVTFFILELQWEPTEIAGEYRFHLLLLTETPPNLNDNGVLLTYNTLSRASGGTLVSNWGRMALTMDVNTSSADCTVDATSQCMQVWSFYSAAVSNASMNYNDTYEFAAVVQQCAIGVAAGVPVAESCLGYDPPLVTAFPVSFDVFLAGKQNIGPVSPFRSNVTLYTNTSFSAARASASYWADQTVAFVHQAFVAPMSPGFYTLGIQAVYLCEPVAGGYAPYIGFDVAFGVTRYGCARPETLNGVVNIPASEIVAVAVNGSGAGDNAFDFGLWMTSAMVASEQGGSFAISGEIVTSFAAGFYLHVESVLSESAGGGQSGRFRVMTAGSGDGTSLQRLRRLTLQDGFAIEADATVDVHAASSPPWMVIAVATLASVAAAIGIGKLVLTCVASRRPKAIATTTSTYEVITPTATSPVSATSVAELTVSTDAAARDTPRSSTV
jgi:hypothetical protein